jgi:hypothetical protein
MTTNSVDSHRAHAGMGEVALATAGVGVARSLGATSVERTMAGRIEVGGVSAGMGAAAGLIGEGAARGLDAATGLDRFQSHAVLGGAGLATALIGRHVGGEGGAIASSIGAVLAVTGGAGAGLDVAHDKLDQDGDGHFFPAIPTSVKIGAGVVIAGGLGLKYGKQAITAARNAKLLAGSAEEVDKAGSALHELVPRSDLTTGPQVFLGGRLPGKAGLDDFRVVMPYKLDDVALRTSLGLPAKGELSKDELAKLAISSMEQQGAYDVDAAGKAVVDMHFMGSPTGMGGLNIAPVMMAEDLMRTATADAQYGAKPSVQSLGKVDEAIDSFIAMAEAHKAKLATLPASAQAPTVGIATSLGGLQFDRLIEREGPGVLDRLGLQKIITLGSPVNLSKLDPATLPEGFHFRGTFDDFAKLTDAQVAKLRFIEMKNPDDPVPLMALNMIWKRPSWFPANRSFTPGVSFAQHAVDITTAIQRGTGATVGTGGHEYRSIISNAAFARALGVPGVTQEHMLAAAREAQDASVAEAKRARDVLFGVKPTTPK